MNGHTYLIGSGLRLLARGLLGHAAYRLSCASCWCAGLVRSLERHATAHADEALAEDMIGETFDDTEASTAGFGANFAQ